MEITAGGSNPTGLHDGIVGDMSHISGDVSGLNGDVTGFNGDVTGINGNPFELTTKDKSAMLDRAFASER